MYSYTLYLRKYLLLLSLYLNIYIRDRILLYIIVLSNSLKVFLDYKYLNF